MAKDPTWVTAMAQVQSLTWGLPHAMAQPKKKERKKKKKMPIAPSFVVEKISNIFSQIFHCLNKIFRKYILL